MAIHTTAEEKRDEAKLYLRKAIDALLVATDENVEGSIVFSKDYLLKLTKATIDIMIIDRKI